MKRTFIQKHQCDRARKNSYLLEQYEEEGKKVKWYLLRDSFLDAIEVNQCPYCKMFLPDHYYVESEIEEVSLLINMNELPNDEFSTKANLIQDWLDSKNIIAYAEKAGEKIQIRWDERVNRVDLIHTYEAATQLYSTLKVGVYFNHSVTKKIHDFPVKVNFIEMNLEEYLLSVVLEKQNIKIS